MTIVIKKNATKDEIKNSLAEINKKKKKGIRQFFGISTENTDAVAFQKKLRNEWD
ncbi:MAG: hypothetical protein QM564_09130 [Bergeyella sp.]